MENLKPAVCWKNPDDSRESVLIQLHPKSGDATAGTTGNVDVVIVSDIELRSAKYSHLTDSLLRLLQQERSLSVNIFQFHGIYQAKSRSVWHSLKDAGDDLIEALSAAFDYSSGIRPLVFVAYGFGGTVVKKGLYKIDADAKSNSYQALRLAQHAVVFFGSPHPTEFHRERWPGLNALLATYRNSALSKPYLRDREQFMPLIADISSKFEQASTVQSILTVCETKPTRVGRSFFSRKTSILLGRDLAEIACLKAEKIITLPTDYHGIGVFDSHSEIYKEIVTLLQSCSSEVLTRSRPDGTDSAESNARKYRLNWASTESNADSTGDAMPTPSGSGSGPSYSSFEIVVAERKAPRMPCYVRTAVNRNPNFVGRSNIIAQIDSILLPDDLGPGSASSGVRQFALCGFGGLGKTQIATYYAFEREKYFDAIFWVQSDSPGKLYKSFRDIAEVLEFTDEGDQADMVVSRDKVLEWLSNPHKHSNPNESTTSTGGYAKWLLIFDNADNLDLIKDFLPPSNYGSILVTSRDPLAKTHFIGGGIDLPPMTNSECALLLQKQMDEVGNTAAYKAALKLVEKLGTVPLAISQIATQIRRNQMTIDEYLGRHSDGSSLLAELNKVTSLPPKEQYNFTVATVWGLEDFSGSALTLMRVMAFLDPDGVAESILEQEVVPEITLPDLDVYLYKYPRPGEEYQRTRLEVMRTSLVRRNNENKTIGWHRQIQEVVRGKMSTDEQRVYYQISVDLLYRAWEYSKDRFNRESFKRKRCDEVLPNVHCIIQAYESTLRDMILPVDNARQLVKLLQETGWYLVQAAQYDTARPTFELAKKICEHHGDAMRDLLADIAFSYARYGEETNMDAQEVFDYCLQFHELRKELNDGTIESREDLATSHTSLAQGFLLLDRPEEAVEHCRTCIEMEAEFPDHKEHGTMSQFAHIYQAWGMCGLGKYEDAARLCHKVIAYREKKFGPNDTESIKLGLALHCLGVSREKQGLYAQSVDAYQKALANFQNILGPDSFRVAQINLKLGEICGKRGVPKIAKELFDQAIQTFARTPYYKPELGRALYKLSQFNASLKTSAADHREDADYRKAVELYCELRPEFKGDPAPGDKEFDMLVRFWSR
ncbi:hypothetical protein B0T16DRAFT_411136 [Cercophora newfieldiana]|uniref:DUF7779 domain-containing protein n=1 Tax=Cercophora newfieldiana TaxID=92897 RepID=A0AA39Y3M5_9PEZI|nr:hypothetical protein B0T16DRAFT_411136 [Cercophora newfieldiana]